MPPLTKKSAISILFLTAYFLLAIHSFIPHHHPEESVITESGHHHDNSHEHDHDHDTPASNSNTEEDHTRTSPNFPHNAEFGKVLVKLDLEKDILEKPVYNPSFLIVLYNKLGRFQNPPRPHPPNGGCPLHLIVISHSLPLRAPPASS